MTHGRGKGALRGAAVLLVALLLALLVPSAAQAHSELQRSDPLDGAVVPVGRTTLTLWFGESVAAASSSFVLRTQDGSLVPTTVSGQGATTVIEIETAPLERNTYQLDWRVFSLDDGHTTSGTLLFGAGLRPAPPTSRGPQIPPTALVLVRWVDLTALLAAIGALTVGDRVLRTLGDRVRRRARTIALLAVLAAWYAGVLTSLVRTFDATLGLGLWWNQTWLVLTETPAGRFWLARQVALTVAVVAVVVWRRRLSRPRRSAVVALLALTVVAGCEAWAGHAATLASGATLVGVAAVAHLWAAGVWAGGLGVLAWCLVPALRHAPGERGRLLGPVWRAYSPLAAVSTVVLLATGLVEAGHHLPDLGAVTTTVYGAGIAAKTVLMVVAFGLAGINTAVVHPGLAARVGGRLPYAAVRRLGLGSPRRFAWTVTAEAALLGLAVALAAVVTSTATSREDLDARRPTTVHVERADGLFVTFEEVPGGPGTGRLIVRLRAIVRPDPAPVTAVDVDLSGPTGHVLVPLALTGPDRYEGTVAEPGAGTWTATVHMHRTNASDTVTSSSWTVEPRAAAHGGPFEVVSSALAALLLALLALTLLVLRRRSRPTAAAAAAAALDRTPVTLPEPAPREESLL
ncbi:copper resistance protein CopC [Nocardioides mesophilus]|uniref:Copper resistance protein CopC/CopD n=1 Tax=Nocardioides mesophilus TaxID=433659 RepID=A0A7G9R7J8_9ACTN|nr:copper resistance protein CopC [Nocardioides mesophilus]QNN51573.1 copper resistance protein CopC/CopD [Nocardioides mesophilus]